MTHAAVLHLFEGPLEHEQSVMVMVVGRVLQFRQAGSVERAGIRSVLCRKIRFKVSFCSAAAVALPSLLRRSCSQREMDGKVSEVSRKGLSLRSRLMSLADVLLQ